MVAYSFKSQFIGPIRAGLGIKHLNERGMVVIPGPTPKRQTIRSFGKRRHARAGEDVQLYYGMRTKHCMLIGNARCAGMEGVLLKWSQWPSFFTFDVMEREPGVWRRVGDLRPIADMEDFAKSDGFTSAEDMERFWFDEHGLETFEGALIKWKPTEETNR